MGGENRPRGPVLQRPVGSSPRGRGKRPGTRGRGRWLRLIPAWAGKTPRQACAAASAWAHPRVGGENVTNCFRASASAGSSPLTRGKPVPSGRASWRPRLIPAHAGKTDNDRDQDHRTEAHPRSRGENFAASWAAVNVRGSSPLTRGKRRRHWGQERECGLIPAHAGKTSPSAGASSTDEAHPRSRGENSMLKDRLRYEDGSSPLTRGKHVPAAILHGLRGLIPAHAGKTAGD